MKNQFSPLGSQDFCDYMIQCAPGHQSLVLLGSLPWLLSQALVVDLFPAQTYLKLFLPSRSAAITSTGSVLPVTFCISGSCDSISKLFVPKTLARATTYACPHERVVLL